MRNRTVRSWVLVALLGSGFMLLVAGCSGVSVRSKQELGLPVYPPTEPASVQILRTQPTRPYQKIGEVAAEPYGDPSVQKIEQGLQQEAAKMGADAVVLQMGRTVATGLIVPGRLGGGEITPDMERIIIGEAIKYTSQ